MPVKVQLQVETDLTDVGTAFSQRERALKDMRKEVNAFGKDVNTSFRAATTEATKFDTEVKKGNKDVQLLSRTAEGFGRSAKTGIQNLNTETRKYQETVKKAHQENTNFSKGLDSVGSAVAGAFSVAAVVGFTSKMIDVRAEFQKFEAVLTNTLGSKSLAQNALLMIQDVAAKTPFSVQELTASFVKLANQGFEPTAKQITKLGDLAASQGKSFDQLTEGIIDAQTGEFERLKEFGIRASKNADGVKFTFKGVETQVKNNSKAIQDYILGLGELEGVAGGMAAVSDTLGGKISNLGDNFDAFFNNLGEQSETVFGGALDLLNQFLNEANEGAALLNQVSRNLKGTSGEIGGFEALGGSATAALIPIQKLTNEIASAGQEAKKTSDFIPIYQKFETLLKLINKNYAEGKINVEEFNRQQLIVAAGINSLQEQQNHLREKDKKDANAAEQQKLKDQKAAFEKSKAAREDLAKFILDLAKRTAKAEVDLLEEGSKEKVVAQQNLSLKELQEVKETLIKKGKLVDANFKISAEQEEQFATLRQLIYQDTAEKLLKIEADRAMAQANLRKKEIDDEVKLAELREKVAVEKVTGTKNDTNMPEAAFEKAKQRVIAQIKIQAAQEQLTLKQKALNAEASVQITALENDIKTLSEKGDKESELKAEQAQKSIEAIRKRAELEGQLLQATTQNEIDTLNKQIEGLDKNSGKKGFTLGKLFGLDDASMSKMQDAINTTINSLKELSDQYFAFQQEQLDKELEANDERMMTREDNINDLKDRLEEEKRLQEQGLANNVDRIKAELDAQNAAKDADLQKEKQIKAEKRKLAKQQLIIDTALQASQMVLAIAQLFAQGSSFWVGPVPVGLIVAGLASVAMVASFAASKKRAFDAVNNDAAGFQKGGYTGDAAVDEEVGPVHGQEFVSTAKTTRKHRALLEGLHNEDDALMKKGILDLIKGRGISLEPDLPQQIQIQKHDVKKSELKAVFTNDNSGMERRLDGIDARVVELIKQNQNFVTVLPDGTQIHKFGNITRTIKSKK